ncbi:hypothetical protein [Blastococcus brunescens]|uniref:Uncharacterized protein n=1 Tax=Blastococcus brunescens TaxID=1564165 RepID=A0ABZ1AZS8_9ACTN|nr:hypothetical protein [Blastococcus sp. BMG 8361]WRL63441.1 hypothetical protein U6N30_27550 [Blastococcus sp. BMG 8361]
MRDIVATIQPDQDDVVRAPLADSICVQGRRARARRRSACTAPPTCSTRTVASWPGPAFSSSDRTGRSCATSSRCSPPWARSTSTRRRSPI